MFTVDVLTTPSKGGDFSEFNPEFSNYKAIVGNYNEYPAGDKWPASVMSAFERYMNAGGGFVAYHAAGNAFPEWKAYNLMIGIGGWLGRNGKSGPYWYFQDGKLVKDLSADGTDLRQGPNLPYSARQRSGGDELRRLHRYPATRRGMGGDG